MERIYQKKGCWILVSKSTGGFFRAATNNEEIYWLIEKELDWQITQGEAQDDLDKFAAHHNLAVVEEEQVVIARRMI